MAATDPVYKKPAPFAKDRTIDARTLGVGNNNVAAAATDRRNNFNQLDMMHIPQATEHTLSQDLGDVGMRTHAQESMNASLTVGRGPDLNRPNGSNTNGPGETYILGSGDQAYGGSYSKRY